MTIFYKTIKSGTFLRRAPSSISNGTRASASLLSTIPKNQTWLAYEDPGAIGFFSGPPLNLLSTGTTEVANLRVEVPPGCTHIQPWLLIARQRRDDPAFIPLFAPVLTISSDIDTKLVENILPTSSSLKGQPTIMEAEWYHLEGLDDVNQTGMLRVRSGPVSKWTDVWVTISHTGTAPGLWLFSAYYRTVPPESTLMYEDGV